MSNTTHHRTRRLTRRAVRCVVVSVSLCSIGLLVAAGDVEADADPDAFDCSELVQWAAGPHVVGAMSQASGRPSQAHVAISLGDGRTVEP
jgi:cell wall-associated NlpC family hydrolase